MTRIVVTDDHPVVRQGIADVLSDEPDFVVVAATSSAEELLREAARTEFDVAVVDVQLPGIDGLEACVQLRRRLPRVRVLILTSDATDRTILAAFTSGARGFAVKSSEPYVIRQGVRAIAAGGVFIDPSIAHKVVALATRGRSKGPFGLTPAEMRVLEMLPLGARNRDIAEELSVSEQTVKTHVRNVLAKLGANDRTHAAAIAVKEGLV